ncbi:MAG: MBL fold metallo-hydrolase [Pseudomonadota bacterium]
MRVRFWGVRGSIPCPGPNTVKYGGNTACIELRCKDNNRLIIIDAGSGLRELGNYMMTNDLPRGPIRAEIFLSHTHWDHIMGFPFFVPIYVPKTELAVYGPVTYEDDTLENIVSGQLTYRYFPVRPAELASHIKYIDLKEGAIDLGDGLKVMTKYLNHPILCLGYRFEYNGKIVCTAYDTEPFQNVFCSNPDDPAYDETMAQEGELAAKEANLQVEAFISGADLLIYDAQYTEQEYQSKKGWGHTSIEYVINSARQNNVKRLALFHHDPMRSDVQIDALSERYCTSSDIAIFFAREGAEIEL